ncbi:hypothetical protein [Ekhidna sp.]|uniref:hypothetical protein n=1 Tax=Ekhidna sp. TaxID=2608089 RepID=UPI003B501046
MVLRVIILSIVLSVFSFETFAQKIKYKDLYPILEAKNYDEGIPKLKQYLNDGDHKKEANPNLQMGIWLHSRLMNLENANNTKISQVGDSALFFLNKAKGLIDEKELKRNDKYYQEFLRRDLRSGKFLIKVSDVHLNIENMVDEVKEKMN